MPNWNAKDVQEWKALAQEEQQGYCNFLSDRKYDMMDRSEMKIIRQKVAYGIYGPPERVPEENNNDDIGYNKERAEHVNKICAALLENSNNSADEDKFLFACVFVCGKIFDKRFTTSIFRTTKNTRDIFVDTDGRVYSSWTNYLSDNKLPKCIYCFPRNGIYTETKGVVDLNYGTSPACNLVNRMFSILDTTATVVTFASMGVGLAAMCTVPIAGPIAAAATIGGIGAGGYGAVRSGATLVDRGIHQQRVGLGDAEARSCWLGIVGGTFCFAQFGMVAHMSTSARAGDVMSKAGRITYNLVTIGSITVNGLGVINTFAVLVDKYERKELTPLDVVQFSASLLFFSNSLVNYKTASQIIKEVQRDVLRTHKQSLERPDKKTFKNLTKALRGNEEMKGNGRVIKEINRVENVRDFYDSLVSVERTKGGLMKINKEFVVHQDKYMQIDANAKDQILKSTSDLLRNNISQEDFMQQVSRVSNENRIRYEFQRQNTVRDMQAAFRVDKLEEFRIGNKSPFRNLKPHEVDRLSAVMTSTAKNYKPEIIEIAVKLAGENGCDNSGDFCSYLEYAVDYMSKEKQRCEQQHRGNPGEFNIPRGIKPSVHFENNVYQELLTDPKALQKLQNQFKADQATISALNANAKLPFRNETAATYHYVKHCEWGTGNQLTPEQYYDIADQLVSTKVDPTNSMLSQEGNCSFVIYKNPVNGAKAVKIQVGGEGFLCTLYYDSKVLQK